MLRVLLDSGLRTCDRLSRRDALQVGALGLGALSLPDLLRARAAARAAGRPTNNASVVLLWLSGGATHIETFDPKMESPSEYRSTVGAAQTAIPGVAIGGLFPKMATQAQRLAFVRSFAHGNAEHTGATHWVLTGYDHPPAGQGALPIRPSPGSMTARLRGASHPDTGMPTYVRLGGIYGDGAAYLGVSAEPFDSGGQARRNMQLTVEQQRLADRRSLLGTFDQLNRAIDTKGLLDGMDQFTLQAINLITGRAKEAFDLGGEDPRLRAAYGGGLGDQLLLARRLVEAGCGFVTLTYSNAPQGWDMHGAQGQSNLAIATQLQQSCPPMDQAVATFLEDLAQRGLTEQVLFVITAEFGRTPKVNQVAGRDHWPQLCPLALAGGGLRMGQVVGESSAKAEVPRSAPIGPQDLLATILHVLEVDPHAQFVNASGRPVYAVEHGNPIPELIG